MKKKSYRTTEVTEEGRLGGLLFSNNIVAEEWGVS